jgi:hypothetical protein
MFYTIKPFTNRAKQEKNKTQIHTTMTITAQNHPEEINGILKNIKLIG